MEQCPKVFAAMAICIGSVALASNANAQLVNGSFEANLTVPVGGFTLFADDSSAITGWQVDNYAGTSGNVGIVHTSFTVGGFAFPAQQGSYWLDLSGNTQTTMEVRTVATTTPGQPYDLTFYVGNIASPAGFGPTTTIGVSVDGSPRTSYVNAGGSATTQTWQQFSVAFTATSSATSIAFANMDPGTDTNAGLDNVVLTPVPEPTLYSLMLAGLGFVALAARRRSRT